MDTAMTRHVVRTILGDVSPADLGRVDAHEHVFLRSPELAGSDFQDPARMREELAEVRATSIDTVVDLTTVGLGRRPRELAEVSAASGVTVVAATGFHRDAHYLPDHWVHRASTEAMLEVIMADITVGIDAADWSGPFQEATDLRAGIIKLGASYQVISASERCRLEVGVEAARLTGAPVAVHTEVGTVAHEILDAIEAGGVRLDRVMLAHLDRNPDPDLHAELCDRGAHLVYDTVGRVKYRPESDLLALIETMVGRGHGERIMVGSDVGRRQSLVSYGGGPGMAVLGREFIPRLLRRLGEKAVERILVSTPARLLTLDAKAES
jgi:predicted metal-dependent phosphotriesterase family hydrolase